MKKLYRSLALLLLTCFAGCLAACGQGEAASGHTAAPAAGAAPHAAASAPLGASSYAPVAASASLATSAPAASSAPPATQAQGPACWFTQLCQSAEAALAFSGRETPLEQVRAAFHYVMAQTSFVDYTQPELTESWRYADHCGTAPTVYQVLAAGPLQYGIGTCEHYAAALVVLLQHLGYQALYVPGLTYSVDGQLVDHAWAMVNIEDIWYHLDPQLEDNVTPGNTVTYKYFLKGDADFAAHHVWGASLAQPDPYSATLPACPVSAPSAPVEHIAQAETPHVAQLVAKARQAQAGHAQPQNLLAPTGSLPPLPGEYAAGLQQSPLQPLPHSALPQEQAA